jgi:hypothetical protein
MFLADLQSRGTFVLFAAPNRIKLKHYLAYYLQFQSLERITLNDTRNIHTA